jgi:hypothetical protein
MSVPARDVTQALAIDVWTPKERALACRSSAAYERHQSSRRFLRSSLSSPRARFLASAAGFPHGSQSSFLGRLVLSEMKEVPVFIGDPGHPDGEIDLFTGR